MNLEWRQPSKKLRFILVNPIHHHTKEYSNAQVAGKVEERKQRNGTVLWEGQVYARRSAGPAWLSGGWKKQMFKKKAEAMAMVLVSIKLENYDGFT